MPVPAGKVIDFIMEYQLVPGLNEVIKTKISSGADGISFLGSPDGMAAFTAANIQDSVKRADVKPVEINGNHG